MHHSTRWVACVPNPSHVLENCTDGCPDAFQTICSQEVLEWKVLHEAAVVLHFLCHLLQLCRARNRKAGSCLARTQAKHWPMSHTQVCLTCVSIKANYCLESLSSLQNVHGQANLRTCSPCLDTVQSTFKMQPEADFLQCIP